MIRIVSFLLLFYSINLFSQSYIGFDADNFNGIHGALFNPANIADSRYKIDINIASASVFTVNNYAELDYWVAIADGDSFNSDIDFERVGLDRRNNGVANVDVLGPSALITLSKKHAIGVTTRVRVLANVNTLDGELTDFADRQLGLGLAGNPIRVADVNFNAVGSGFAEVGLTYARVLKRDRVEFLKGGVTLKYLRGLTSTTAEISDGILFYDPLSPADIFTRGEVSYSFSENLDLNNNGQIGSFDDDNEIGSAFGLGIDLGVVYEYRPKPRANISRDNVKDQQVIRHITTYKYKIAASILDIGFINYNNQKIRSFDGINFTREELLAIDSFNTLESVFEPTFSTEDFTINLPTRIRGEFDWRLSEKIFLNAATSISLIGKRANRTNRYANQFTISPRFESKWFTAYVPVTTTQYGGVQVGLGGRLGPVFMGTSGFFSRTFDNRTRVFDLYAGLKIPIFHKTPERKNLADDTGESAKFNCKDGCPRIKKEKVKRFKGYKGKFNNR